MKSQLKAELCHQLISQHKVKEFDVIEHSFTDNGTRNIDKLVVSTDGIFPTITTRPDCLGIVVKSNKL